MLLKKCKSRQQVHLKKMLRHAYVYLALNKTFYKP